MKGLVYILGMLLLLTGCRNNPHSFLRLAEEMWNKAEYDSVQYYLVQVDSSALRGEALYDYYWLRLHSHHVLGTLDTMKTDSLLRMLEEHYPEGHDRAFRTRLLRVFFTFSRLKDNARADSLLDCLHPWMKTGFDSVSWYSYKLNHKHRMGDLDSTIHYLHQTNRFHLLRESSVLGSIARLYKEKEMPDSAIHYYSRMMKGEWNLDAYRHAYHIFQLLDEVEDKEFAWNYLKKLRGQMKRKDIPFVNLVEGDIKMRMHQPDSAMKHYQLVAESEDVHLAALALERMGAWMEKKYLHEPAFDFYHKSMDRRMDLFRQLFIQQEQYDYVLLKQENLRNELKMEQQRGWILLLAFLTCLMLTTGGGLAYYFYRKNRSLKEKEELASLRMKEAMLREKDARMREELLQRIHVKDKLHSDGHIQLTDADWKDIRLMLDATYPDFTQKLQESFPALTEKDINFCCLVRIKMSLQNLSDIYCISGNSVSRKKLRLKEKLGIDKEESLTQFLNRFT